MSKPRRKTLDVNKVIELANQVLEYSVPEATEQRIVLHTFVTNLLLSNDSYAGFNYVHGWNKGDNTRTFFYKI